MSENKQEAKEIHDEQKNKNWKKELAIVVVVSLLVSLLIKSFLLQSFYIPSQSMQDTLQINDRILVNVLVPGAVSLQRGDVVVFEDDLGWLPEKQNNEGFGIGNVFGKFASFVGLAPDSSKQFLVKRVIGLSGDEVVCCNTAGNITVNGTEIIEPYIYPGDAASLTKFDIVVPENSMWVLGDHRSDSKDSRYNTEPFVNQNSVVGRAFVVMWPFNHFSWLSNYGDTFKNVP